MKSVVIVVLCLVAVALAADECFHAKTNHKWAAGTDYNPIGECISYKCLPGGGMSAKTCPSEDAVGNCKTIAEDLTKPYPDCCPKIECA